MKEFLNLDGAHIFLDFIILINTQPYFFVFMFDFILCMNMHTLNFVPIFGFFSMFDYIDS